MSFSIVILSRTASKVAHCIAAIRSTECKAPVMVVWDRPEEEQHETASDQAQFDRLLKSGGEIDFTPGIKPFVYARNSNIGIQHCDLGSDVILLNDDAVCQNRGALDFLAEASVQHDEIGVMSALIFGMAAAPDQQAHARAVIQGGQNPTSARIAKHHMLAFICVYLRRQVLDRVGLLDERFIGYGYEDDDYCKRVLLDGLHLGVADGCQIEHGTLPSTFRGQSRPAGCDMLAQNRELFAEKWGAWGL